jgi:predicted O-linked N-acetylglucosamine transferase (SPINDLY family)
MDDFFVLYKKLKNNSTFISVFGSELVNKGVEIYNNKNIDLSVKENVLSKLIEIYPNEPAFYYYMGYCFKDVDPNKAVTFFEKSYDLNPYNIENLIDYCNALHNTGNSKKVIQMDKSIPFGDYLKDYRLLNVFVNCKYKEGYYKDLLSQLLFMIKLQTNTEPVSLIDKEFVVSTYMNTGHIFSNLCDHENSMVYTEKAFNLSEKFNLTSKTKFGCLQNYIALENYKYHDHVSHYNKALLINRLYPNIIKYEFNNSNKKKTKIRIGYVSSDFFNHAVSNFILPILKNHNTELFEIFIFDNKENVHSRMLNLNLTSYPIFDLSDEEAANLINRCEIDILFELNGYTDNSRLGIFSLNPAPIQIAYLGYPNTTGLQGIQYRITDNISDNENSMQKYSETLIKMPKCFLIYNSVNQMLPITPRKTKEMVILGSLNNEKKNSKEVLKTWKTILEICPNTKLLIKLMAYDDILERQKYYMHNLNVTKDRLILITKLDDNGYNKLFSMVDILLDTFPYSGTTTTCNSLYNSIPVVTMYHKDYHSHNVSSSILKNAGLDDLVTYNNEEYISLVKKLVENPLQIDEYKQIVGKKFADSMNSTEFMISFEKKLKELYEKHNNIITL